MSPSKRHPSRLLFGLLSVVVLATATAGASRRANADYTPMPPGQGEASMALGTCNNMLRKSTSPGMVSTVDFWDYRGKLEEAKAKDPEAVTKFAAKTNHLGLNPKELFPRCDRLIADYLKGIDAEKQPALAKNCEHNVESDFRTITREAGQLKAGTGSITLMRMSVERSRQTLYVFTGRKLVGFVTCAPNDQHKAAFAPVAKKFKEHEAIVLRAEAAAGIKYTGSRDEGVTLDFIDLKTNKPARPPAYGTPIDFTYP